VKHSRLRNGRHIIADSRAYDDTVEAGIGEGRIDINKRIGKGAGKLVEWPVSAGSGRLNMEVDEITRGSRSRRSAQRTDKRSGTCSARAIGANDRRVLNPTALVLMFN
jgi:hypothetical protein